MPFIGCDGEGGGADEHGRQNYLLLRVGDAELFNANKPLSTVDCLDTIASAPRNAILVGFSFGYDVTMILRDLPEPMLRRMLASEEERQLSNKPWRYVYYRDFGIEYLPRQYFRVCRLGPTGEAIKGSSRTVYEVFGFFQMSFLKALKTFRIGEDFLAEIEANKEARGGFDRMTKRIRNYCRLECDLLVQLMERFREVCIQGGIVPRTWNGAGKLAAALHREHKTIRKTEIEIPPEVMAYARAAYYGGRFEITRTGRIEGPIHEHDIRSAYPAAMQSVPCLVHGRWEEIRSREVGAGLYLADVSFRCGTVNALCGLPIRNRQHRLFWPRQGRGIYWSVEIDAAQGLGVRVEPHGCWVYHRECDCKPFGWVENLYRYRRSIGASDQGYPIKLGINALYGQLARRIGGGGPWQNHLWAGYITALTRSWLMRAAATAPSLSDVLMLATDGIYATCPLGVPIGDELGQWEHKVHPSMFIVQPGLYWGPPQPKTRGVPRGFFLRDIADPENPGRTINWCQLAERAWDRAMERITSAHMGKALADVLPAVPLRITNFIGTRLALARNKPLLAGVWSEDTREIRYDWQAKRSLADIVTGPGHVTHRPHAGGPGLISLSYGWTSDTVSEAQELQRLTEAMPDYLDFGAPGFA